MLRPIAFALALVACAAAALAAAEEDRRDCAGSQDEDTKVAACTRLIGDAGTAQTVRAMAYRNRGIVYLGKSLQELAVADLDEAIKLSPTDIAALGNRGRALNKMGQYDRALADYTELLRLSPRSERAYNERGLVRLRRGDLEAALADFDAALDISPRMVFARNNRGAVFGRQSKFELAIVEYTQAIALDPEYLLAYSNRASAYEETGNFELALADYKYVNEREGRPKSDDDKKAKTTARQRHTRLTALIAEGKAMPKALPERRVALVIGNGAYVGVPALRNPPNDAKALAEALRKLGFSEVRELYNADLSQLGKALKAFGDLAAGSDWAVIYYAGHGIAVDGVNYLLPTDAQLEQQSHVDDEAMPLSRLLSKVAGASKMQLVILDACRNNPFVPKMRQAGRQARAISKGLVSIEPEAGALVAYSARDGTTALDGDTDNSPYTTALLRYMGEPGLEISLLFRKVREEVLSKTERQQEPLTYGSPPAQPFFFKR